MAKKEKETEEDDFEDEKTEEEEEEEPQKRKGKKSKEVKETTLSKEEYRASLLEDEKRIKEELEQMEIQEKQTNFFRTAEKRICALEETIENLGRIVKNLDSSMKILIEK